MFLLVRVLLYVSLFVGFVLLYIPGRVLTLGGVTRPDSGPGQIAGIVLGTAGVALALWSIVSFARLGRGTPAPFDPPRRLVTKGPYRHVRNPMYIGASIALSGAALIYGSWALLAYAVAFILLAAVFVLFYEEPTLRATFGPEYESYCSEVKRWWPSLR